jgi:hypothetical protein
MNSEDVDSADQERGRPDGAEQDERNGKARQDGGGEHVWSPVLPCPPSVHTQRFGMIAPIVSGSKRNGQPSGQC